MSAISPISAISVIDTVFWMVELFGSSISTTESVLVRNACAKPGKERYELQGFPRGTRSTYLEACQITAQGALRACGPTSFWLQCGWFIGFIVAGIEHARVQLSSFDSSNNTGRLHTRHCLRIVLTSNMPIAGPRAKAVPSD